MSFRLAFNEYGTPIRAIDDDGNPVPLADALKAAGKKRVEAMAWEAQQRAMGPCRVTKETPEDLEARIVEELAERGFEPMVEAR